MTALMDVPVLGAVRAVDVNGDHVGGRGRAVLHVCQVIQSHQKLSVGGVGSAILADKFTIYIYSRHLVHSFKS